MRTGSADPATHKIYIWDISNDGQFATALDGGREPLIDIHVRLLDHVTGHGDHDHLQWHPQASRLASTTNQGSVLIWHCPSPERWGAFAGGFEEADENVMYEEGEAEFDIVSCTLHSYPSLLSTMTRRMKLNSPCAKSSRKMRLLTY